MLNFPLIWTNLELSLKKKFYNLGTRPELDLTWIQCLIDNASNLLVLRVHCLISTGYNLCLLNWSEIKLNL